MYRALARTDAQHLQRLSGFCQCKDSSIALLPPVSYQPTTDCFAASELGTMMLLRRLVPCRRSAPAEMVLPVPEGEEGSSGSSDDMPPPGIDQATPSRASPGAAPKLTATMSGPSRVCYLPAAIPSEAVLTEACQFAITYFQTFLKAKHPEQSMLYFTPQSLSLVPELNLTLVRVG